MADNYLSKILKDNTLKPELKRALKSALNSNSVMPIKPSEMENFFDELECQAYKIRYTNNTPLKYVKSVIKAKLRDKSEVLAVLRGNKKTTLDHLNSIWTAILSKTDNADWGYYLNSRHDNSLYLFVK
jgi:hypothetical protein